MFISNRIVFLKKKNFEKRTDTTKVELDEVRSIEEPTQTTKPTESDLIRSNPKPIIEALLRRSGRVLRQSDRYYDFLVWDGDPVKFDKNNEDPITYMDAMQRSDFDKWLEAMKSEIESMKINDIWTFINPLEGVKSIGCKWIFKRKRGADGKIETYKVCLVIKKYHQRYGIDYDEIFSPVTMLKFI